MTRKILFMALAMAAPLPLAAQSDFHFTHQMASGDRLDVSNINGSIVATRASGRTAEITVTKTVKRGNGDMVKAIMEESSGVVRVCTIYTNRRDSCHGDDRNSSRDDDRDRSEVEMHYEVHVPAGVELVADNVNGDIDVSGLDAPAKIEAVNGMITFDGAAGSSLNSVNGKIRGTFAHGSWDGTMHIETVNGNVDLTFPADLSADIKGETVNGSVSSPDFPITIDGKWGPKSFSGRIGKGGSALKITTVNGSVTLHGGHAH